MEGELRCERLSSPLHDSGNNEYFLSEESLLYPSLPPQRRNANYKPSLWADSYIQSLPDGALATAQVEQWEELKEEIRHLIKSVDVKEDEVEELLCLFDTLRQLGASYHFEREIKSALSFIASSSEGSLCNNALKNNLYGSALLFRLLREYCIDDQNQTWRVTAEVQHLPNCMKKSLMAIFSTVYDIASNFSSEKGIDIFPQLQQIWKYQCKAYFLEAKWYNAKYTPTLNEFLGNAYISSVGPLLETASYCFSESLNKEALHRIEYKEDILRYSSTLARLYNDWSTSTSELPRGDIPKSIQCYMKEKNVSESTARYHMKNLIEKYWKKLNGQYFSAFNLEESYKRFVLNLPRLTIFLYYYGDRFAMHHCETKDTLNTLIVEPIPL